MGIARPVMEQFPHAWIFFVLFILVATFTMLNLFIAIIVNAMQNVNDAEHSEATAAAESLRAHAEADMHAEFRALREEMRQLRDMLAQRQSP
jgi:voltage-gated sodium channel